MKINFYALILILFIGCNSDTIEAPKEVSIQESSIKYAKGFQIEYFKDYKVITLNNAWRGDKTIFKYVLYENDKPENIDGDTFIKTPINSIACMSLTHVALIEKLDMENTIVALSGCDYVSSNKVRALIESKEIKEIGVKQNTNYEMLVEEAPNLVMGYGIDASSNKDINKLKSLGLKLVLNSEYMETHPLGKAEWLKFMAAFYNEDEKAQQLFNAIEIEYLALLDQTKNVQSKPSVFTGMPWNGTWYVPGGESFQAQLFKDAGANYLWKGNKEKSSLVKDKEIVIDEAYEADFWLNQNSYGSVSDIIGFDEKFKGFSAVKTNQLFNNDLRANQLSGNDYWESGVINPHIVLKDLIEIFHPEILDHQLYYYRKLD